MHLFNKYDIAEIVYYFVQPNHEYNGFWRIKERMKTLPHLNREDSRQEYVYKLERRTSSSSSISISWIKEEDLFKTKEESEIEYYKRLENKKKEDEEKRKERQQLQQLQFENDPFGEDTKPEEWFNKRPRQNRARNERKRYIMIKKFKIFEQMDDPFGEEQEYGTPIVINDIYDFYFNHSTHYSVFNGDTYEIKPMEKRDGYSGYRNLYKGTCYLGLREAGNFFAYNRKYVWVFMTYNPIDPLTSRHAPTMRHQKGFSLTITTVDDSALYADWNKELTEEELQKVVEYFDFYTELDKDMKVLKDIEDLIGKCTDFSTS